MVLGGVVSRDGLGLGRVGAPGYRAHCSVAMAPMFKGIRFGRQINARPSIAFGARNLP